MAYQLPVGATLLIDGATVTNGNYSTAGLLPLASPSSPVVFYVKCDQSHTVEMGTVSKSTTTVSELDIDLDYKRTGKASTATYGTNKYVYYPDAGGYAWCRVKNDSGGAAATVSIWGVQI